MSNDTVADKLREARKLIERGWTRGELQHGCRYCSLGAIVRVTPPIRIMPKGIRTACFNALAEAAGVSPIPNKIAEWNDAQRSKKTVLAAFDKAIELAVSA